MAPTSDQISQQNFRLKSLQRATALLHQRFVQEAARPETSPANQKLFTAAAATLANATQQANSIQPTPAE
jgi:hypothetical protein